MSRLEEESDPSGSVKMDSGISGGGSDTPTSTLSRNEDSFDKKAASSLDMERRRNNKKKKTLLNEPEKAKSEIESNTKAR